jgi:16S rRNA (adenine(1408)-N(1))-methyltransferase
VLARAHAEPRTLTIGIDANAASMIESSRRAARPDRKGGRPNALFVVAAAEAPPPELACLAGEVTIVLPWGSLLAGVLGRDERVTAGVASLVAPGGRVRALVSTTACDGPDLPALDDAFATAIAGAWARHGLSLEAFRRATVEELAATPSTWARRLRLGARSGERSAWRIDFRRSGGTGGDADR